MEAVGEPYLNWESFQCLDRSSLIGFLTSSASVLRHKELIGDKEVDAFRFAIAASSPNSQEKNNSLLVELHQQKNEILSLMIQRFGVSGFLFNVLRYTLVPCLRSIRRHIAELGELLVTRSEMHFNRQFRIYSDHRQQRITLYSAVLVEWSEVLACSQFKLAKLCDDLHLMNGHDMYGIELADGDVDFKMAEALGFREVFYPVICGYKETEILKNVAQVLKNLAQVSSLFLRQLTLNTGVDVGFAARAVSDRLCSEAVRLDYAAAPEGTHFIALEMYRRYVLSVVTGMDQILKDFKGLLPSYLNSEDGCRGLLQFDLPESMGRRVAYTLMSTGVSSLHAEEGARLLMNYLSHHRIKPGDILVGELQRIHFSLNPKVLDVLKERTSETVESVSGGLDREMVLSKLLKLREDFAKVLSVVACLVFFCLSSCGLKTNLKSEVVEFRPDIPFHSENNAPNESKKIRSL